MNPIVLACSCAAAALGGAAATFLLLRKRRGRDSEIPTQAPGTTLHPGLLFRYHDNLVAFLHTACTSQTFPSNVVVFIGGLGDRLLAVDYLNPLAAALGERGDGGWGLVEVALSSGGTSFGYSGGLEQDVREIRSLLDTLGTLGVDSAVLLGHSTGCQDIVALLTTPGTAGGGASPRSAARVAGAILQAPVSDREYATSLTLSPDYAPRVPGILQTARAMIEGGRGDECLPRAATEEGHPMTANRYVSLHAAGGGDDLFSSDSVHCSYAGSIPVLVVFSMQDEYVPAGVDKEKVAIEIQHALSTSTQAGGAVGTGGAARTFHPSPLLLERASHAIDEQAPQMEFVEHVCRFVEECATADDAKVALILAQTLGKQAAEEHRQTQEQESATAGNAVAALSLAQTLGKKAAGEHRQTQEHGTASDDMGDEAHVRV